jgi:hypothetical protein
MFRPIQTRTICIHDHGLAAYMESLKDLILRNDYNVAFFDFGPSEWVKFGRPITEQASAVFVRRQCRGCLQNTAGRWTPVANHKPLGCATRSSRRARARSSCGRTSLEPAAVAYRATVLNPGETSFQRRVNTALAPSWRWHCSYVAPEVASIDCWQRRLVNRLPVARYVEAGVAALLLLALLPVLGLLSLGVLFESRGPLLVRRNGTNRRGEPVRLLVFRTTTTTTRHGDPRPTRAGWLLRRTGLNEAPLLWYVVRGDISLSSIG